MLESVYPLEEKGHYLGRHHERIQCCDGQHDHQFGHSRGGKHIQYNGKHNQHQQRAVHALHGTMSAILGATEPSVWTEMG